MNPPVQSYCYYKTWPGLKLLGEVCGC